MALFDNTLLFFHAGTVYNFTAGEFVNLAGTTATSTSTVVNLGNARDLGIGPGQETPKVLLTVGTAITSSSATNVINAQFQGSTDSSTWTTYAETGYAATTSLTAGASLMNMEVPRRPPGAALPLYYRVLVNWLTPGLAATTASISTGTVIGGIVLTAGDAVTLGQYPAGYTVA